MKSSTMSSTPHVSRKLKPLQKRKIFEEAPTPSCAPLDLTLSPCCHISSPPTVPPQVTLIWKSCPAVALIFFNSLGPEVSLSKGQFETIWFHHHKTVLSQSAMLWSAQQLLWQECKAVPQNCPVRRSCLWWCNRAWHQLSSPVILSLWYLRLKSDTLLCLRWGHLSH